MDDLIGRRVLIYTADGESESATVLQVGPSLIRVQTDAGVVLIGNQWDEE